jgi:SAM-dependent methyltransferase
MTQTSHLRSDSASPPIEVGPGSATADTARVWGGRSLVEEPPATPPRRLNWGCGNWTPEGWINSDVKDGPGVDLCCDIREGLPLPDDSFDYIVSIHALPELSLPDLVPALEELRRVLKPGGTLRLGLPDLDRAFDAYRAGDDDYFVVPDEDAQSIGAKFVTQLLWYGYSKSFFIYDFIEELLDRAGYVAVARCAFKESVSRFAEIVALDNRPQESLFVEAAKPGVFS